jgi:DNA-binding transcriptional regulator YiaG
MDLGLYQSDVARVLNVSTECITYWENNRSEPQVMYYPRIIEFLKYLPFEFDTSTLSGRLKEYRYTTGLSQKNLAKVLKIDPSTIALWESVELVPHKEKLKNLELLLTKKPLN